MFLLQHVCEHARTHTRVCGCAGINILMVTDKAAGINTYTYICMYLHIYICVCVCKPKTSDGCAI